MDSGHGLSDYEMSNAIMPTMETKEGYISKILEEKSLYRGNIIRLAILDRLTPDVFPLTLRGDKLRRVRKEDEETFKKLYEKAELIVMNIGYLTGWEDKTIYRHLREMGVKSDPSRRSETVKEEREFRYDRNTLYFETNQPIVEEVRENVIRLDFSKVKSQEFWDGPGGLEEFDLSELIKEHVNFCEFFYSPSKGYLGLKVDGFMGKYPKYIERFFQNVMGLLGLTDVRLVKVEKNQ